MWNLLSNIKTLTAYRPSSSAASGGTFSNPTYAYDASLTTYATCTRNGSAVSGTPIDTTFAWSGFTSILKANFSVVYLRVMYSEAFTLYTSATQYISAMAYLEYSLDGGSTWNALGADMVTYHKKWLGTPPIYDYVYDTYPASVVTLGRDEVAVASQYIPPGPPYHVPLTVNKSIPSVDFSTGLDDLQVRVKCNTLTSGANKSQSETRIYDIVAFVP